MLTVDFPSDANQLLTKGCVILFGLRRDPHPRDILKAVCSATAQSHSIKHLTSMFFPPLQEKLLEQEPLEKW